MELFDAGRDDLETGKISYEIYVVDDTKPEGGDQANISIVDNRQLQADVIERYNAHDNLKAQLAASQEQVRELTRSVEGAQSAAVFNLERAGIAEAERDRLRSGIQELFDPDLADVTLATVREVFTALDEAESSKGGA